MTSFDTNFVEHYFRVMKNMTITVPEPVAKWARVWAARHNMSVSKLVGEMLTARMDQETGYDSAMKRYLGKPLKEIRKPNQSYPRREELHER